MEDTDDRTAPLPGVSPEGEVTAGGDSLERVGVTAAVLLFAAGAAPAAAAASASTGEALLLSLGVVVFVSPAAA